MTQTFEYPNLLTGSRSGVGWAYWNGHMDDNQHHLLYNSTNIENYIFSPLIVLKHGITYEFSVYTANTENCAGSKIFVLYEKVVDGWIAKSAYRIEKGPRGGWVTFTFTIPDASPEGNYYIRFDNNGSTDGKDALVWFADPMLCVASEPHAWAPAEGETLTADVGGVDAMSSNLLNGITPTLLNGVTKDGDVYTVPKKTNDSHHTDHLRYHLSIPKLGSNRKFHVGFSRKAVSTSTDGILVGIAYKDDAGNYGYNYVMCDNSKEPWTWFSDSIRIPSGMTIDYLYIAAYRKTNEMRITNVTLSYDAPVALAMSEITATDVKDGKSPTVSVSKSGTVTTIVVTNADGSKTTQTVNDGTNGTPGTPGADGKTPYFHVKYSNDGGKTFTANGGETAGTYIGTCTDYNSADPTSVGAYTWAKIKGEIGDSVSSITEEYYLSASNTSQTGGSWATTPQSYVSGRYYWTRSHIVYKKADGSTYSGYTTPVLAQAINSANETADTALASANGKGKSYYQAAQPSSGKDGDLWFKLDSSGNAIGIYKYNGKAWVAMPIESDVIASLEAAKINAGTLNGMKIVGSTFVTPWKYYEKRVTGIDFALVYTGYSRIRITNDGIFFDNFIKRFDSDDDPTDSTSPTSYFQFYFGTDDSLWLEDVNGGLQRVLLDSYDGLDAGVTIHSGSGSVAFNSGDSATPTKILNKNYFGEPVNSMPIGDGSAHTISFGWTGSRLRPVIDGNQIYMPVLDTIFYDPNNGMGSGVSLTSAATNYDALDIFCKTDDGVQLYTKVCNPKVGTTFEVSVNHMNAGGGHMWMKTKQFIIDGESHISTAHSGANWHTGILRIDSNSTPTAVSVGDYITIIKVVGWKY